jgi:hypothetical protein
MLIGGREPVEVTLSAPDPGWASRFEELAADLPDRLAGVLIEVEYIGSTAVPGLAAKPIVDVLVLVPDPEDERDFVPALAAAGLVLRVREPGPEWIARARWNAPWGPSDAAVPGVWALTADRPARRAVRSGAAASAGATPTVPVHPGTGGRLRLSGARPAALGRVRRVAGAQGSPGEPARRTSGRAQGATRPRGPGGALQTPTDRLEHPTTDRDGDHEEQQTAEAGGEQREHALILPEITEPKLTLY